jgi:UDP-N-acetylglucosamine acyltransferase
MIQPLAYIHPQAKIADNVVIEPFVTIHKDVEVGEGTWIGSNCTIMDGARIGKNCRIFPGAVISAAPQDLKYRGEPSTVSVGDNTVIRECVTLNRGTALDKNTTTIGSNCLLMAYVHVAHDCVIGDNVIIANSVQLAGHINIYDYAFIGGAAARWFVKTCRHLPRPAANRYPISASTPSACAEGGTAQPPSTRYRRSIASYSSRSIT